MRSTVALSPGKIWTSPSTENSQRRQAKQRWILLVEKSAFSEAEAITFWMQVA
jgi:hypothetical protein